MIRRSEELEKHRPPAPNS